MGTRICTLYYGDKDIGSYYRSMGGIYCTTCLLAIYKINTYSVGDTYCRIVRGGHVEVGYTAL